jgi:peptidyl-prolyl cis-trans isomerase SurA
MRSKSPALLMTAALFCAGAAPAQTPGPATRMAAATPAVPPTTKAAPLANNASVAAATPAPVTTAVPAAPMAGDIPTATAAPMADGIPSAGDIPSALTDKAPEVDPDDNDSIASTVNDQSISEYEVRQRMALYIATSGLQPDEAAKKRIRTQILESLQDEKIKLAEALKKHITVSPTEIDRAVNRMVTDNRFTLEQLRATLEHAGTSEAALRSQILAQIAWQKVVQDEYGDRALVTPDMVDAEMRRLAEGANKPHFLVGEIFLPVDSPEQNAKVLKDAENVYNQVSQGAPFQMVARQFSQSPSAAGGGDIGWVYEGQLAPELNEALAKLQPGEVAKPIRGVGGYYIVMLRERQEAAGTKIAEAPKGPAGPDGTLPLARLLLPLSPTTTKEEAEQVMKVAMQVRARITSCEAMEKFREQMPGSVFMNLGDAKLEELSPEIRKSMDGSRPGDVATPFISEAGIELIARCDKRQPVKTAYVMPQKRQVEESLFDQQISTMARRYLRDLKRDANIQVRDEHGAMQLAAKVR